MSDRAPRATLRPAERSHSEVSGTATVTVASKLPHKLRLCVQESFKHDEPVLGGGLREVTKWRNIPGKEIVLNGTNVRFGEQRTWPMVAGYALTPNIDKALWDGWCEQNRGSPLLENKMLFAYERQDDTIAKARENRDRKSGFEPIDPTKPIRMGQGFEIKPDDSMPRIDVTPPEELV